MYTQESAKIANSFREKLNSFIGYAISLTSKPFVLFYSSGSGDENGTLFLTVQNDKRYDVIKRFDKVPPQPNSYNTVPNIDWETLTDELENFFSDAKKELNEFSNIVHIGLTSSKRPTYSEKSNEKKYIKKYGGSFSYGRMYCHVIAPKDENKRIELREKIEKKTKELEALRQELADLV